MGRNNYQNRHQTYSGNRYQVLADKGDDRGHHDGHDRRYNSDERGDYSSRGNKTWTRGGVHNRLGPRVNFVDDGPRRGGISKRSRGRKYDRNIHVVLPEDDEDMGGESKGEQAGRARPSSYIRGSSRGRYSGRSRGGPGRTPPGIFVGSRSLNHVNTLSWQKVTLKNGSKYDKIVLLKELLAKSNIKFIPLCYTKKANDTYFYLEDSKATETLRELDKKIEMPDGYPLGISVDRAAPPAVQITPELLDKIKVVMSNRYIVANKALNLKAFHADDSFAGEPFYAPLWRTTVLSKVLTVVIDEIPELVAMDLSNNKVMNLDGFSSFKSKLKELRILHLADNRIQDLRVLDCLQGLGLVELKLTGNPIVNKLTNSTYTADIRKRFPKLERLDDRELPKEIRFDGEDEPSGSSSLPPTIQKMVTNTQAEEIVVRFMEQYFKLYDSDSRQPLLDAYHEEAVMSLSASGKYELMQTYIRDSRNLTRIDNEKRKHDLLHRGKLQIVAFLSKLPRTEHDMTSFTLDVPFTSPTLMTFTITGLFRERDSKRETIRHFNRCFIVMPQGSGFCIINELLYVCTATNLSSRKAFSTPAPTPVPTPAPSAIPEPDDAAKQAMAIAFSEKSGMNLEWSVKCLEQSKWDFDKSAVSFSEAKTLNKIPPEAYVK